MNRKRNKQTTAVVAIVSVLLTVLFFGGCGNIAKKVSKLKTVYPSSIDTFVLPDTFRCLLSDIDFSEYEKSAPYENDDVFADSEGNEYPMRSYTYTHPDGKTTIQYNVYISGKFIDVENFTSAQYNYNSDGLVFSGAYSFSGQCEQLSVSVSPVLSEIVNASQYTVYFDGEGNIDAYNIVADYTKKMCISLYYNSEGKLTGGMDATNNFIFNSDFVEASPDEINEIGFR